MSMQSQRVESIAADWLARRDCGAWTKKDDVGLADWLAEDATHRVAFLRLQAAWAQAGRLDALGAGQRGTGIPPRGAWSPYATGGTSPAGPWLDPAFDLRGITFGRRAPPPRYRLPVAAAAAICVLALGWSWRGLSLVETTAHATALGDVHAFALADGSLATLASDSRIEVRLSRHQRQVELQQGEAYFEAAKDPDRPFVVKAGERRVVAVGTRFSVRRDGHDLRIVVTEGTVRLGSSSPDGKSLPATV